MGHTERRPRIAIAGEIGSGKSVAGQLLTAQTGFPFFSTGQFQRRLAEELGMSTLELNHYSEDHPEVDHKIDAYTQELEEKEPAFIIDSRMAWHFLPGIFRCYLRVNTHIAAARIISDSQRNSEAYADVESAHQDIVRRGQSEAKRFQDIYGVNCRALSNYDLVIDTSFGTPEDAVSVILGAFSIWQSGATPCRVWLPPKLLHPTALNGACAQGATAEGWNVEAGKAEQSPVTIIERDEFLFIREGHGFVSRALHGGLTHIPVLLQASESFTPKSSESCRTAWEAAHGFIFDQYPSFG